MSNWEEKYGAQLTALLDGTLPEDAARTLRAEIARNPEMEAAYRKLSETASLLQDLGHTVRREVPTVDLVGSVMNALPAHAASTAITEEDGQLLIAHLEGADDELADARMRKRLDTEPALRKERDQLAQMDAALLRLGRSVRHEAPRVDLVDDVMARLPLSGDTDSEPLENALRDLGTDMRRLAPEVDIKNGVMEKLAALKDREAEAASFQRRTTERKRSGASRRTAMLVVAMAALVLVLLSVWLLDPRVTGTPGDSTAPAFNVAEQSQALRDRMAALRAEQQENFIRPELSRSNDANRQATTDENPDARTTDAPEGAPSARDRQPLTVQAAQALRRQALLNDLKREEFARMASLTPEEALAVLEQRPITPEAVLGATQFLEAGDAVSVLEEAITQNPDNPYLRAALASRQGELGNVDAQLAALKSWGDLDPQNGLPLYEMADTLFAQGDVEGGMQALRAAGQRPYSTPYAVDTARYHEAALSASGMESDVSRYFAASVAGNEEYARLANLQQSLLAQGEALEASGDLAGAADVYDAVRDMGQQLAGAASLPSVLQAGYEAELAAVDYLAGIPEILTPDTLNALSTVFDSLWQGLTQAIELTQSMNDLLDTPNTQDLEQTITDILTGTFLNPPG